MAKRKAAPMRVYTPGEWADNAVIRQIVGRCHVAESNRKVVEYAVSRFRKGVWSGMSSLERREIIREVIKAHRHNRHVYSTVMRGRF